MRLGTTLSEYAFNSLLPLLFLCISTSFLELMTFELLLVDVFYVIKMFWELSKMKEQDSALRKVLGLHSSLMDQPMIFVSLVKGSLST